MGRIKQGLNYLFVKPKSKMVEEIKLLLTEKEYEIFINMDNYDKVHSIGVYEMVKKDSILNLDEKYLKLALLHDCGKEKVSLLVRMKKVLVGDKQLDMHPKLGYKKLKEIDMRLANLILNHHGLNENRKLKRFQEIDEAS
ncbi:MAG: HD domain-containing protein [Psychrilyobacter sp.]|uniref:HD domain-containing protein n=1 Tax=Psychrilyobacter sp. TaxID=2586924 RepID=UPI003C744328